LDAGKCEELLADTQGDDAYSTLFRGIAEGCLGQYGPARADLDKAVMLLYNAPLGERDDTCGTATLLKWAYETYLQFPITPICPLYEH